MTLVKKICVAVLAATTAIAALIPITGDSYDYIVVGAGVYYFHLI